VACRAQIKAEFDGKGIRNVEVWNKGIDTQVFDPKFKTAAMREQLSEVHAVTSRVD
jgi:hypothetical protein